MSRRKKHAMRAIYNPHCPDCVEGWAKVELVDRWQRPYMAVRRCHCYRIEKVPVLAQRLKPTRDAKMAAGGDEQ